MADRLAASSGGTRLRVVACRRAARRGGRLRGAERSHRQPEQLDDVPAFFNPAKFHKWQVVAAAAYDVVIFADADLDSSCPSRTPFPRSRAPAGAADPRAPREPYPACATRIRDRRSTAGSCCSSRALRSTRGGVRALQTARRPGRRLGRRRSRRRGGASGPLGAACGRARAVRLPAPQGDGRRVSAASELSAHGARRHDSPWVRARGPATRGSC